MTLAERAAAYLRVFDKCGDAVWVAGDGRWLYGVWHIGADYRNDSTYYGAYPTGFLDRVDALFPDVTGPVLHAFSGSLMPGDYVRCDVKQDAEYRCKVEDLPSQYTGERFELSIADPPYSKKDAEQYRTTSINRGKVTRALAEVGRPGGHLVWLDTVWPMHRKDQWKAWGMITLVRSTNHRVRMVSLFERVSDGEKI